MSEIAPPSEQAFKDFYDEVEKWQSCLDGIEPENPLFKDFAASAVEALDALCPYKDEFVQITGRGLIPIVTAERGLRRVVGYDRYSPGLMARHQGVTVTKDCGPEDIAPHQRIMHMVRLGEHKGTVSRFEHRRATYYAYFQIEPATTIQPVGEIEEILRSTYDHPPTEDDARQCFEDLTHYAEQAAELQQSSGFLSLTPENQAQSLQALVDQAELAVNVRDTFLTFSAVDYVGVIGFNQKDAITLKAVKLTNVEVKGACLGLESLENIKLRYGRQIRQKADLFDKDSGLYVVLSPDEETRQTLQLPANQAVYVPLK